MTKSPPRFDDVDLDPAADDVVEGDDARPDPEAERGRPALGLARGPLARRSGARSDRRSAAAAWPPPAPSGRRRAPRACSSRGRPCRRRAAARRPRRRAAAAASGGTGAYGPRAASPATSGPSSQCEARASAGRRGCPSRRRSSSRGLVGVLEAQDERAAGVAGEQVVEQRRPGRADVERPGRARRDPDPRRPGRSRPVSAIGVHRAGNEVEQRRVRLAGEDPDERGRPQAERRAPARTVERQRVERLAAGQDRDVGAGRQRARLEVRQQARRPPRPPR